MGLLWRLNGVEIPNPNHWGMAGTTGGPVSMLNNTLLDNSDFMTGAFPAEYGNALSGLFDLIFLDIHLAASIEKYRRTTPESPDIGLLLDEMKRLKSDRWQQKFVVQYADKLKAVKTSEIAYFEAREKSVFLVTGSGTGYAIDYTLDRLESVLDPSLFFRVNRKFIVNFGSIRTMHLYPKSRVKIDLIPKPDQDVIVSSERSARFREWLTR